MHEYFVLVTYHINIVYNLLFNHIINIIPVDDVVSVFFHCGTNSCEYARIRVTFVGEVLIANGDEKEPSNTHKLDKSLISVNKHQMVNYTCDIPFSCTCHHYPKPTNKRSGKRQRPGCCENWFIMLPCRVLQDAN